MTLPSDRDLQQAIGVGCYDEALEDLVSALVRRRTAIAATKAASLQVGDHFIIGKITPKAFTGARAEVIGFKGKSIECVLLEDIGYVSNRGNYSLGAIITIPPACVGEKL